ncbi:MAG: M50 family metallopeptidase [Myxococcales bacterium]|nr:M50 family metallopeptidase [Myxococcota bacterium]MDW8283601.1 M50 family metallopeptidase [Myxococcales bacterium]
MLYLVLAILSLGILVIIHEAGHFLVARWSKMRVDLFSIGFGPPLWRFTRGETTYQVAAVPLGGFVQIAGLNPADNISPDDPRAYPNRPVWQRFLTIFAGPGINYLFAAVLLIGLNLVVGVQVPGKGALVSQTMAGRPAAAAGLRAGDEIVAIDGQPVRSFGEVAPAVEASGGRELRIEVLRDGQRRVFQVKPVLDGGKWRIGIGLVPTVERQRLGAWVAIRSGLSEPLLLTWQNLQHFADAFRGRQKLEVGGPVEIVRVMKQKISMGFVRGIEILAFISTMLGFFNLLPLPALDGGRLVFLAWEVLSRRPVNQRVEQWVHAVGMVALLLLISLLVVKDVRNIIVGG